jgi:hypothetical protein
MSTLENDLAELENLDLTGLRESWAQYYCSAVPASMSRELLMRAIGYKMQEAKFGGLNRQTCLKLSSFSLNPETKNKRSSRTSAPPPKSGTKFLREWQGKVHEVLTLEDGQFAYAGNTYRSLTMIARRITKTHQSGPRFFGLKDMGIKANG